MISDQHRAARSGRITFVIMCVAFIVTDAFVRPSRAQPPRDNKNGNAPATANSAASEVQARTQRIERGLRGPTEVAFTDAPLVEALTYLEDLHAIEIQIDKNAFKKLKVSEDTPVTLTISGISLHSALKLLLEPLSLAVIIDDGKLVVTDRESAKAQLSTLNMVESQLAEILGVGITPNDLTTAITTVIEPTSWQQNGGQGTLLFKQQPEAAGNPNNVLIVHQRRGILPDVAILIQELADAVRDPKIVTDESRAETRQYSIRTLETLGLTNAEILEVITKRFLSGRTDEEQQQFTAKIDGKKLIVTQTREIHRLIGNLFQAVDETSRTLDAQAARKVFELSSASDQLNTRFVRKVLSQPMDLSHLKGDLSDVLELIAAETGLQIHTGNADTVRPEAFTNVVDVNAQDLSLSELLDKLLDPASLSWYVEYPELIVVTSREDAATHLELRAYRTKERLPAAQASSVLMPQILKIEPKSWYQQGGPGRMHSLSGILIVNQTARVHQQITEFLSRQNQGGPLPKK